MDNKIKCKSCAPEHGIEIFCKSRVVDPLFIDKDQKIKRISKVDKKWEVIIKKESKPKKYYLKFEK